MKKAYIIDYQLGNLFSVNQALVNIGLDVTITANANDIARADAIILPGVGAFKDAMNNLNSLHLTQPLKNFANSGKPFLGICLGLQLLFEESDEFGASAGLGLISGNVKKFANADAHGNLLRVPQIAWNTINQVPGKSWEKTPLEELKDGDDMYFVHSYYVNPAEDGVSLAKTTYGGLTYTSSVLKNNIFACQFHPEKSSENGLSIYKNWALLNNLF